MIGTSGLVPVGYYKDKAKSDKTFKEVAKNTFHSFVATFLLVALGVIAALSASFVIDKNFFTLLLSYCPGEFMRWQLLLFFLI